MQTHHNEPEVSRSGSGLSEELNDASVLAERFLNVAADLAQTIRSRQSDKHLKSILTLPDREFVIDAIVLALGQGLSEAVSPEKELLLKQAKSKAKFLDHVAKHGGVLTSAEVANVLGVSKVTVKSRKDSGKLFAILNGTEFVYPAFQFNSDGSESNGGTVHGLERILSHLKDVSDVRKFGFFTKQLSVFERVLPADKKLTILDILKMGASERELEEIVRLAKLYGTQDAA